MNIFLFQVREIGVTIDPDAVHDVIDSLFRLGRNASDYSPLTPQQACSVQCIVWGNRKRSIDLTIVAEIQNINTRLFLQLVLPFFLKDQPEFFYTKWLIN